MIFKSIDVFNFKYHVSCTDGKISVRINLLFDFYFPLSSHPTFLRKGKKHANIAWDDGAKKSKTIN